MVSQRQKSALYQKEAVERSEKASFDRRWRRCALCCRLHNLNNTAHCCCSKLAAPVLCRLLQNLCLFRVVEAFNGSTVMDIMQSIVSAVGLPAKLVMPRKIQDNKKVLYRVRTTPTTPGGL